MEKESGIRVMDGWMDGCKQAAAGFYYSFDFDCGGGGGGGTEVVVGFGGV